MRRNWPRIAIGAGIAVVATAGVAVTVAVVMGSGSSDAVDRSLGALLAWSTFVLAIATALLFLAAIWAGLSVGKQVRIADATRRGALAPFTIVAVTAGGTLGDPDLLQLADVSATCRIINVGPGPNALGMAWLWLTPPGDDGAIPAELPDTAPEGLRDMPERVADDDPPQPFKDAHYWRTIGWLPPAGSDVGDRRQVSKWHRTGVAFPPPTGAYTLEWRVEYQDVFEVRHHINYGIRLGKFS